MTHRYVWNFAPGREAFSLVWIPSYCPWYASGLLWGPIDDALMSTRLVQTYQGASACELPGGGHDDPCLATLAHARFSENAGRITFPGAFVQRFHYSALSLAPADSVWRTGLPDNAWVEVMRIDRIDLVSHSDTTTCTVGQLWMWLAPGSGVWYNLGRSQKAITTGEASGLWWSLPTRPCTMARQQGYDSIQLIEFENGFSFEILDCRGADRADFDVSWDVGCPPPHVELRSGIPPRASRWAPHLNAVPVSAEGTVPCACDPNATHINCDGSPTTAT